MDAGRRADAGPLTTEKSWIGRKRMTLCKLTAATCLAAALVALTAHGALSETAKTIKIIVPYSPGNGPDILARLLGQQVASANGPNVVIENRPGGGAVIGADAVARAAPDGTTLLLAAPALVIND